MTDLLIPTEPSLTAYRQEVEINSNTYGMRFYWNARAAAWFVDISNDAGEIVIAGRKCNIDVDLIEQYHHKDPMPIGILLPYDTGQRKVNPLIDDFGTRVLLLYIEP